MIKSDAGGDSKICRKRYCLLECGNAIDSSIHAAGNKHLSSAVECDAGWICDVTRELRHLTAYINAEKRDGQLFTTRARACHKECSVVWIECRIGKRMKI